MKCHYYCNKQLEYWITLGGEFLGGYVTINSVLLFYGGLVA